MDDATKNPITRRGIQRLRATAIIAADSGGDTRFAGTPAELEIAVGKFQGRGPVTWFYSTKSADRLPWPAMIQGTGPRPDLGAYEAPLMFAERLAELNRAVYRDAYANTRELMGATLEAMTGAMVSLSNRLITVESKLEEFQEAPPAAATPATDPNDELVRMVIDKMTGGK